MFEFRFHRLTENLREKLDETGIPLIEEDFKKEGVTYVIYGNEDTSRLLDSEGVQYAAVNVEDTGWDTRWKDFIRPGWLTDNIYFAFSDENLPDGKVIRINPSLAFGTGTHATTQNAARLLEKVAHGRTVIDAGCGSAILSVCAKMCGAEKVFAFDIDAQAMGNAAENIRENNCPDIHLFAGTQDSLKDFKIDIYMANIITSVLTELHPKALRHEPEYIIYSGILSLELDEFLGMINIEDYELTDTSVSEEWTAIILKRIK